MPYNIQCSHGKSVVPPRGERINKPWWCGPSGGTGLKYRPSVHPHAAGVYCPQTLSPTRCSFTFTFVSLIFLSTHTLAHTLAHWLWSRPSCYIAGRNPFQTQNIIIFSSDGGFLFNVKYPMPKSTTQKEFGLILLFFPHHGFLVLDFRFIFYTKVKRLKEDIIFQMNPLFRAIKIFCIPMVFFCVLFFFITIKQLNN